MRKGATLLLAAILTTVPLWLASCDAGSTAQDVTRTTSQGEKTFSLEELAEYDGTGGRPAYVAVDGVVYDLSASSLWPDGTHSRCSLGAAAGQDLSVVITQAPASMRSLLQQMPVVGSLE